MKKFGKLMIAGLLAGGLVIPFTGCVDPEPFVPPEGGSDKVIINDAYDWNEDETGSTRPNLGGGYESVLPPAAIELTIAESSAIRFKGGATKLTVTAGNYVKPSDFDESTLDGHTVEGFAVTDETGAITSFVKLEDFLSVVPVTVIPYFAAENGEFVTYGSNKIGDYYYDENGNDVSKNTDYQLVSENVLLNNLPARKITAPLALGKGSYFRALTAYGVESGQAYTVRYSFKNLSEQPLSFTVYQMLTGAVWNNPANRVASDPVVLQPGEDKSVSIKIRIAADNTNLLTLIRLNEDAEALNFAVSMSVENSTASRPATITLNLPEGFKVAASYKTQVNTNEKLVLPTKDQITNETGHKFLGWVYSNSNNTAVTAGVRIKGDISIEPLLTEDVNISFTGLPEGVTVKPEYETLKQTGDKLALPTAEQLNNPTRHKLMYWEYAEGGMISDGVVLTESITIKPMFTKDVTVTLELPEGITVSEQYSGIFQESDKLVLPTDEQITNETGHRIIRWVDEDGNAVDGNTVLNENITIKPELTQNATITVVMPDGLAVASDYKTDIQTGDILVVPTSAQITGTIPNGRTLLGWYDAETNEIIGEDYVLTKAAISIAPYFSRMEGTQKPVDFTGSEAKYNGTELVFANIQGNGKPHDVYDASGKGIKDEMLKFTAVDRYKNTTPIGGGVGGYTELGNVLQFNGTLGKDYRFRGGAMITGNSAGIIEKNVPQTFFYNFQNFGDTKLDFTIYGLNSGTSYEGEGVRVQLEPGESTQISFTVAYANAYQNQVNKNAMAYFWINEEVTNMKLGISINVVIKHAKVTLSPEATGVTLSEAYLGILRHRGDKLTLPTANDYVNTTGKEIVGWKDAEGNTLTNETVLSDDIVLVPVFAEEGV